MEKKPEKTSFRKEEVDSHSSMLTNSRIDELIRATSASLISAMSSKPDSIRAMELFSLTFELYTQTQYFYDDHKINQDISKKLNSIFSATLPIWRDKLWVQGINNINFNIQIIWEMKQARFIMIRGMQNLKYFTRMGIAEIKGIDAALRMFGALEEEKNKDDTAGI